MCDIITTIQGFHVASSKAEVAILEGPALQVDSVCSNTTRLLSHTRVNYCRAFGCNNWQDQETCEIL